MNNGGQNGGQIRFSLTEKAPTKMQETLNALRIKGFRWSFQADSNCWPHPYQGCALPAFWASQTLDTQGFVVFSNCQNHDL